MKPSKSKLSFSKKKLALIFLLITLAVPTYYGLKPAPYRPKGFQAIHDIADLPRFVAHKSKINDALPNSRHALEQALESNVSGIELDVRMTKDNIPVIFHGEDLSELTNGKGPVEQTLYQDIKPLYYTKGDSQTDKILSLDAALQIIGDKKHIFLDIKDKGLFPKHKAKILSDLICKHNLRRTVIVESFNPFFLYQIKKAHPANIIMYDYARFTQATEEESQEQLDSIPWVMKQAWFLNWVNWSIKPDILGPRFNTPLNELRALSSKGYPLIVWTIDDEDLALILFNNGVYAVQSNIADTLQNNLINIPRSQFSDAGRIDHADVQIIRATSENDIYSALLLANQSKKSISLAGRRHTQGGHTFGQDNLVIDMRQFNQVELLQDKQSIRVQSGASWEQIQHFLNEHQLAVKIMQSDNIFTVGGTLSANAHGWQVGMPPISSTVKSFRLMLADGRIVECSREQNQALFSAALGGYGLIGVILDVVLEVSPNYQYQSNQWVIKPEEYVDMYKKQVTDNPKVDLAYGRLSISKNKLLEEAILHTFYRFDDDRISTDPIQNEKFVRLKQKVFRNSQRNEASKAFRWNLEKSLTNFFESKYNSRNNIMSPDIHVLWPLEFNKYDILHEYFIPKDSFIKFVTLLKQSVLDHDMNLLNVTIREVKQDTDTLLNYAKEDMFGFVLYFSQDNTTDGEARMKAFTQHVIDQVININGSFYLPYRPHYTQAQFEQVYPQAKTFRQIKQEADPNGMFTNTFYERYIKK